jgi:hypothetical protein
LVTEETGKERVKAIAGELKRMRRRAARVATRSTGSRLGLL